MTIKPPDYVIVEAVMKGAMSPCAKSKRGAVAYNVGEAAKHTLRPLRAVIVASDYNGPPQPMTCDGSATCQRDCGKICQHAESRVIGTALADMRYEPECLNIVHAKVVNGRLVAGGPPSCASCSGLVLEQGIGGVWLFEGVRSFERPCIHCGHTHAYTTDEDDADNCPKCDSELHPISKVIYSDPGTWRFYTGEDFHRTTLKNLGLYGGG